MDERPYIYSIGHSNHGLETFLGLLRAFRIETLVDVRSSPYSRYMPHFNRLELEASLKGEQIEYLFAGEYLGGRPKDPSLYKDGRIPIGKADYLNLVDYPAVASTANFQRGLYRLVELALHNETAMMCSEENPFHCHRHHLIARALHTHGMDIRHIRRDRNITEFKAPENQNEMHRDSSTPVQQNLFA